jgi:hypothetical protein
MLHFRTKCLLITDNSRSAKNMPSSIVLTDKILPSILIDQRVIFVPELKQLKLLVSVNNRI